MTSPRVSVIVPAYNSEATLRGTLAAVCAQTFTGGVEVIVVDDGSTDATPAIVAEFPSVIALLQPNAGPAAARNLGAARARGEVLFFTDSDCVPEPRWVEKMMAGFSADDIGAVAGSYGIANPGSFLARGIHGEILFRHKYLLPEFPRAFGSYNVAVRKDVFDKAGGFDPCYRAASGEDNDLSYRVLETGYRIRFCPDVVVDHYHQKDAVRYLREQFRHGFWRARMYRQHPAMMRGDDYTFWKDMAELPMAVLLVLFVPWPSAWFFFFGGALIFEAAFAFAFTRSFTDAMCYGAVMLARACVRTAGFLTGILFFCKYLFNKEKKPKKTCEA